MILSNNRLTGIVTFVIGAVVVAALLRFNRFTVGYDHYIVGNLIGLLFVPMLAIFFIFRDEPANFGFTLGSSRKVWALTGAVFVALIIAFVPAARWEAFQEYYPIFRRFPEFGRAFWDYPDSNPWTSQPLLMAYAFASYGLYLFCWEFFFRGFLLFGLRRSIGWGAVVVQALAFGLLHYGKPTVELVSSFGAGLALGIIALNAKSFVPCFALHWAAQVVFDLLVVASRPR